MKAKDKNVINLAFFGLGSVGQAVVSQIANNRKKLETLTGKKIVLYKACVRNTALKRAIPDTEMQIGSDPDFILKDKHVDVCIELIGGVTLAGEVTLTCLKNNVALITANKHLLAEYGTEVFKVAAETGTYLGFEASVCGGLPIIKVIRESFAGENIKNIVGILNGTSNFILSSMSSKGLDFDTVLNTAQKLGYAEADPSFDVDGIDAAHKLIILMNLAFSRIFDFKSLPIAGIRDVDVTDVKHIDELGYKLKLIGRVTALDDDAFEAAMSPALIPNHHQLASVSDSFNAVMVEGEYTEKTLFYGKGAGGKATANSVVADLIDCLCDRRTIALPSKSKRHNLDITTNHEFYISFKVKNIIESPAKIANLFNEYQIHFKKMIEYVADTAEGSHPDLIIITHQTTQEKLSGVLEKLNTSGLVLKKPKFYPILT